MMNELIPNDIVIRIERIGLIILMCFVLSAHVVEANNSDPYISCSDESLEWAFGKDYGLMPIHEIDETWNRRHGNIFRINGWDNLEDTWARISKAYEERS